MFEVLLVTAGNFRRSTVCRDYPRPALREKTRVSGQTLSKPGTAPGNGNGFWLNFGSGWAHLANDDLMQLPAGASPRLYFDPLAGDWKLIIEATMFVTGAAVNVWTGSKQGGSDPVGDYTRISGCDPTARLTVEAV